MEISVLKNLVLWKFSLFLRRENDALMHREGWNGQLNPTYLSVHDLHTFSYQGVCYCGLPVWTHWARWMYIASLTLALKTAELKKKKKSIWNNHKCLRQLFLIHLNIYVMGLRSIWICWFLQCGDRLWSSYSDVFWRQILPTIVRLHIMFN